MTMNTHHSRTTSARSIDIKVHHYRVIDAKRDGVEAAKEKYPSCLIPVKYQGGGASGTRGRLARRIRRRDGADQKG
jgi:hypothetical protein